MDCKKHKRGKSTVSLPAAQVTVDDAMTLAMRHYSNGNLTVADRTFRDIIASIPDYHPAVHHLGLVCFYRGDIKGAVEYTGQSTKLDPKNALYLNNYAVMLSEEGQKDAALIIWDRAIKADPGFADPYSNKANTLWQLSRFKEAAAYARKAIDRNPKYTDAMLNLGNALVSLKKFDEAIKYWRRAIKIKPDFDKAWSNIGNALREKGDLKGAQEACLKAVAINTNNPQAWSNLGNAQRDLGSPKEAEHSYRKAAALLPSYADAHNNLAICLMDQHRYPEALESIRYAIAFRPDYAEAFGNMSLIQRELGNLDEAENAARKAILLQPDSASFYLDLSDILFLSDRYDEAEATLLQARKLTPDSPRLLAKLASVLDRANRMEEALEIIEQALEMAPDFLELHMRKAGIYFMANMLDDAEKSISTLLEIKPDCAAAFGTLAEVQQSRGQMDKSHKTIRKALKLNNKNPQFYHTLTKCKKFTKIDPDFRAMLELAKNERALGKAGAAVLHFALFEAYENIGDYRKAFAHLKLGNDLKRASIVYDAGRALESFDGLKNIYTPSLLKGYKGKGCKSDMPIFIVGMPRSGTTLTEQIISSHPDVFGAGELVALNMVGRDSPILTPENVEKMGQDYIKRVLARYPEIKKYKHFTDKMPGNFANIGQIACILPNAKIIHCRRDPIDTCLSNYKQMFARGQYWSYNLEEMAEQYKKYEDLMAYWRKILPGRFLDIDYEDTVGNLEKQARRLIDFVGLKWNDACLMPHKQKRTVLTASKTQVIKPVYRTSVKSWKRYEKELQPLIKGLKTGAKKPSVKKPAAKKKTAPKPKAKKPAAKRKKR